MNHQNNNQNKFVKDAESAKAKANKENLSNKVFNTLFSLLFLSSWYALFNLITNEQVIGVNNLFVIIYICIVAFYLFVDKRLNLPLSNSLVSLGFTLGIFIWALFLLVKFNLSIADEPETVKIFWDLFFGTPFGFILLLYIPCIFFVPFLKITINANNSNCEQKMTWNYKR